jgi:hypothetical protein
MAVCTCPNADSWAYEWDIVQLIGFAIDSLVLVFLVILCFFIDEASILVHLE